MFSIFLALCIFYSFVGAVVGTIINIVYHFSQNNWKGDGYAIHLFKKIGQVMLILILSSLVCSVLFYAMPLWLFQGSGVELPFFQELVYFLFSFAACDLLIEYKPRVYFKNNVADINSK